MWTIAKLRKKLRVSVTGANDVTDTEALKRCGVETDQYFISATDKDNTNIMIAQVAKEIYRVQNVTAIFQNEIKYIYSRN